MTDSLITGWQDPTGDVWDINPDGTLTARGYPDGHFTNWKRADVERVWGQLVPAIE